MPVTRLRGATIAYDDHGRGAPLIFLHGIFVSRSQWWRQVTAFSNRYRVITCDLRGHGGSSATTEGVSVESFADDVATLLDCLELDRAVICGHSFGGLVAQEVALRYPERVTGLILAETMYSVASTPIEASMTSLWATTLATVGPRWMLRGLSTYFGFLSPGAGPRISRDASRHLSDDKNANRIVVASLRFDTRSRLGQIRCPTLLVVGGFPMIPTIHLQALEMLNRMERASLVVIPCAGHMVHWDNSDEFNRSVSRFVEDCIA